MDMKRASAGLKINRRFTKKGKDPLADLEYEFRTSRITNPDGSVVFEMKNVEVPKSWTQVATDILAQKYFRKKGVPDDKGGKNGSEWSIKQVAHRLAGTWRHWGEKYGYFASKDDAQAYEDEMKYTIAAQMGAPNSPQWFNTGLSWAYGIKGEAQGHYYVDEKDGELKKGEDAYSRPQPHACFIQSIKDDLVNEGGIFDLMTREARLFKFGSGTGTNFSAIRGKNETLSGGGRSSGLMSFLQTIDRAAGAIKSGGTTRRAAKMVCLDLDHPEVEDFIDWKVIEEQKVAALHTGSYTCYEHLKKILKSANENGIDPQKNPELKRFIKKANEHYVPLNYIKRILMMATQGMKTEDFDFRKYDMDFRSEAYLTVSGQNSNNSLRVPNSFLEAVRKNGNWDLKNRTDGSTYKSMPAKKMWDKIAFSAWACADPGVQYDTTINEWHTCPEDGRINASNPCVTGDTLVSTSQGLRRIDELVGKEIEIIDRDGNTRKVDRVFPTGHKSVYELKTKNGYRIKVTGDHLIYTENAGYIPASHLNRADTLVLGGAGAFGNESLEEGFAEALGLSIGDGCLTTENDTLFITLDKQETELAESVNNYLNSYRKKRMNEDDKRSGRTATVSQTATSARVQTGSRIVIEPMKKYAILNEGSHKKQLKDAVYGLNENTVAAILRGLFTADGTVADYGEKSQYISLDSCSLTLLTQVQTLLLSFGMKSKLYENRRSGNTTSWLPDGKGGIKEYPVREMHSLRISRSSRVLFAKKIGFIRGTEKEFLLQNLNDSVGVYKDAPTDLFESLTYLGEEDVYDLTEPVTHAFFANGILVHNCSEYMFLDDTACNLSSINLIKFFDQKTKTIDTEALKHTSRLWTITLEISVLMAQFPSKEIAQKSFDFRTLGLGYANLSTVLMQMGIPYSSEEAYAICGAITAIMCGESYATSAEMAEVLGPFAKYEKNKKHMLRVMENHRRAAYNAGKNEYEGLSVTPHGIQEKFCPDYLVKASQECWDRALMLGEKYGYRNAQTTCIAPTGTIGLVMDCDTTGIEPDFAIVKFKKLVGGGYFKIVNQSLDVALHNLGYSEKEIEEIEAYAKGHATLEGCPFINKHSLEERGFTEKEILAVELQLSAVFDLKFAFNRFTLTDDFCRNILGFSDEVLENPNLDILKLLGFTEGQIEAANEYICGGMTIEGAPHLKEIHYPIFDCANRCGKKGKRFLPWSAHLRMMAAAQPFISGAISKTINMPEEATVEDTQRAYFLSWEYMLKAVALYRDGSKLNQPLNTAAFDPTYAALFGLDEDDTKETIGPEIFASTMAQEAGLRPIRKKLPSERQSITHKFTIGNHEGYLTVGLYEDGSPGELFIKMSKEGSTLSGIMDAFALTISLCLQYGVPLEVLVAKFCHSRFEPSGMTGNRHIPMVKSIVDYIGRYFALKFLPKDLAKKYHHEELIDRAYAEGNVAFLKQVPVETQEKSPSSGSEIRQKQHMPSMVAQPTPVTTVNPASPVFAKLQTTLALKQNNEDAPMCGTCGVTMVRNGSCYKCLECGETSGCS